MIQRMLAIWSLVPLPFLKPAWTSGSSRFTYFWSLGLENFEQYSTSVWDECSCAVVWTFIGIDFLWDWNEHWPFPILWPLLSFPDLLAYWAYCLIANLFSVLNKYSLVWCTTGYLCIHLLKYFLILPNFDDDGGLACCDSWGRKESDTTEWLYRTALKAAINIHVPGNMLNKFSTSLGKYQRMHCWILWEEYV